MGGIDPSTYERDPVEHLDQVFGLCERHQVGADIHLHERGDIGWFTMDLILERVRALGMQGRVTISHAFVLATVDSGRQIDLAGRLGRPRRGPHDRRAERRGAAARRSLREAGVRVGLGQDGIRDYWSPYGDGDHLRRAWQLAFVADYRGDEDIEHCVDVASRGGRAVVAGGDLRTPLLEDTVAGLAVGAPAELLIVDGDTVTSAVMDCPPRPHRHPRGHLVARDGELLPERESR